MTELITPTNRGRVALSRFPALTWTHACAFGGAAVDQLRGVAEQRRTDAVRAGVSLLRWLAAVITLPMSFMILMTAQLRGGLYASTDDRVVIAVKRRSRPLELLAILAIVGLPTLLAIGLLLGSLALAFAMRTPTPVMIVGTVLTVLIWTVIIWIVLGGAMLGISSVSRRSMSHETGEPIPAGPRWTVESLAARTPRDGAAAFLLAKRIIAGMPPGQVVVATARTASLRKVYLRLGFTAGTGPHVHLVT